MNVHKSHLHLLLVILLLPIVANAGGHFRPPTSNLDPMNIYVIKLTFNGVNLIGEDEVAVFDGGQCAGASGLGHVASRSNPVSLIAYKEHDGDTGFREGYPMTFKAWDASLKVEHTFSGSEVDFYDMGGNPIPSQNFEGRGSVLVSLQGSVNIPSYTLTMNATNGGTTDPLPGDHEYSPDAIVDILAIPDAGWQFDYWEGNVTDPNSASTTVEMTDNKSVTAHFTCTEHTVSMNVSPPGGGTTVPTPGDTLVCEGEEITVKAIPANNYEFVGWTGGVSNPGNAITTLLVDGDESVTALFQQTTVDEYTLTMQVNQTGWGTTNPVVGNHDYPSGTVVNITATPAPGFEFVSWSSTGGNVYDPNNPSTTVTMNNNITVTANFTRQQVDLTMEVNQASWGTTSPTVGTHTYNRGDVVSIIATPNNGYEFDNWTGDTVDDPNSASTNITMDAPKTVKANFTRTQYTLTIQDTPGGSTNPVAGVYDYYAGDVIAITAIPAGGYQFVQWQGDAVEDELSASTTVLMDGNKTVSALFTPEQTFPLTISVSDPVAGITDPVPGIYSYTSGQIATVTASANPGYNFVNWTGDVSGNVTTLTIEITMDAAKSITANFAPDTAPQHTLSMQVNQAGWGNTDPSIGNHDYNENTVVTIEALPNTGYRFVQWLGAVANQGAISTTVLMDGDKTVTAIFEAIPQYTLNIQTDPPGDLGGTANLSTGDHLFYENRVVDLEAYPNSGYRFSYWEGDVANPNSPSTTITMNADKNVIVHFVEVQQFTITIDPPDDPSMGTTDPPAGTYTVDENQQFTIVALPNSGYQFVNWNNDPSLTDPTLTFTVGSNATYKPYFKQDEYVTLHIEVNEEGWGRTIPRTGKYTYEKDDYVRVEAKPYPGYRFSHWEGDCDEPYEEINRIKMTDNKYIEAIFEHIGYTLSMNKTPSEGGTIIPRVGFHDYQSWTEVDISATPRAGYKFTGWTGDVQNPLSPNTIVVMDGNKEVIANFADEFEYTLTINVSPSGSGTTTPTIGTHAYTKDEIVTVTAIPDSGYKFKHWRGGVADSLSAQTTVQITSDKNITAVFELDQVEEYVLTLSASPLGSGTTQPTMGIHSYSPNEVVTLTATPNLGYSFDSWIGDVDDPKAMTTTITMDEDKSVTAVFQLGNNDRRFSIDVYPKTSGTTIPAIGTHYYPQGTVLNIIATPEPGFIFDYWTGDVAEPYNSNTTVTIDADKGVIAHFKISDIPTYSLSISGQPEDAGTVIPAPGDYTYTQGAVVTIQAIPDPGFEFVQWNGDVANPNSATTTVTMTKDQNVLAIFQQSANSALLTMQVNPLNGGTTGPMPGRHAFALNEDVSITAVANTGFVFSHWTGDVVNPQSVSTTVFMSRNKTVTAHFIPDSQERVTLTISSNPADGGTTQPISGSHSYLLNEVVSLLASPAPGFQFVGWTGDVQNPTSVTTTITMSADKQVIANFEKDGDDNIALSFNVSPVGTGTTAPAPGIHMYSKNQVVTVSAIPYEGYYFAGWYGLVNNPNSPTTSVVADSNKEITAMFEPGEQREFNLILLVNPQNGGITAPPVGTHTYLENEVVNITTLPSPGYVFKRWVGAVEDTSSQTTKVTMTGPKTVIADYDQVAPTEYTLTVVVNPSGGGTTIPSEGGHAITADETVTLVAVPNPGFRFENWVGDVDDPNSMSTSIKMTGNKTVTANFIPDKFRLTMVASPAGTGYTVPSIGDTLVDDGSLITIKAIANEDYRFAYWSGDFNGSSNPATIKVDNNIRITATFVELDETISQPQILATSTCYRNQVVHTFVRNAQSNLGHDLEYEFDWGDGQTSGWVDLESQAWENITMITTPVGGSGLPSSGELIDYNTGNATPVTLSVRGGSYQGNIDAWSGEEPFQGTDAWEAFGQVLNSRGTITYVNTPNDRLTLDFRGMQSSKNYIITFYANRNKHEWNRASTVTLIGADNFVNMSSNGSDERGEPVFGDAFSPNTKLPADNTYLGYIARFANVNPGSDGMVTLTVSFAGVEGHEFKGKYGSAVMIQEIDPATKMTTFVAYNDLAWDNDFYPHVYKSEGSFLIRVRARCKNHPGVLSAWSDAHSIIITGCTITTQITSGASASIIRQPDLASYDYGSQVRLEAVAGENWTFSHWGQDRTDSLMIKQVYVNNSKSFTAHFKLLADVELLEGQIPTEFALEQNFPNPFNPTTEFHYALPAPQHVTVRIYDIRGRLVSTLIDMQLPAGRYKALWDATDDDGRKLSTGLYFYRLEAGDFTAVKRMILLK